MVGVKFMHFLTKYSSSYQIEKNEVDGICSTYGASDVLTGV
jgi:hypothetical protein